MKLSDYLFEFVISFMPQKLVNILRGLEAEGERRGRLLEISKQQKALEDDPLLQIDVVPYGLPSEDFHKEIPRRTSYSSKVPILDRRREFDGYLNSFRELLTKLFSETNIRVEVLDYDPFNHTDCDKYRDFRTIILIEKGKNVSDLMVRKFEAASGYGLSTDSNDKMLKFLGPRVKGYDTEDYRNWRENNESFIRIENEAAEIYGNLRSNRAELVKLARELSGSVELELSNSYGLNTEEAALLDSRLSTTPAVTPRSTAKRALG